MRTVNRLEPLKSGVLGWRDRAGTQVPMYCTYLLYLVGLLSIECLWAVCITIGRYVPLTLRRVRGCSLIILALIRLNLQICNLLQQQPIREQSTPITHIRKARCRISCTSSPTTFRHLRGFRYLIFHPLLCRLDYDKRATLGAPNQHFPQALGLACHSPLVPYLGHFFTVFHPQPFNFHHSCARLPIA